MNAVELEWPVRIVPEPLSWRWPHDVAAEVADAYRHGCPLDAIARTLRVDGARIPETTVRRLLGEAGVKMRIGRQVVAA